MTERLTLRWPDPLPFVSIGGRPIRILAVSDEPDLSMDSAVTRERIGKVDLIIGAGDLEPDYLSFVADAFHAPLRYIRGNHDVGSAWSHTRRTLLPEPMRDGKVVEEVGLRLLGFSGSPIYNERGMQVSSLGMWARVIGSWSAAQRARPVIVVTHAPPRDVNDDDDRPHRGFTSFRWLADRLAPPLWLHGHTALVRRGIDDRTAVHNGTLFYNCTGATLIELLPPDAHG
ncbi:MAG TPA: metallophosphoesterase [Candidatus Limnocylindrales bacterium]|nr:metallophosphoesterase [Candidatus Limnocylindrales bacterium]